MAADHRQSSIMAIWFYGNEILFDNKPCDSDRLLDLALLRIDLRCKSKWPDSIASVNACVWSPATNNIKPRPSRRPLLGSQAGCLKFNTDAAVMGVSGRRKSEGSSLITEVMCLTMLEIHVSYIVL
ncbi:hypothetical protein V6N13_058087 [Hibiscus sabdariffa]|uniref:Uncharacterized protein n=1 Tax=Hibiscus sabdariffa TaxID=183260 RepID=A0ABR2GI91_9ROSI